MRYLYEYEIDFHSHGETKNDCFCAMYVGYLNCRDSGNVSIIEV